MLVLFEVFDEIMG